MTTQISINPCGMTFVSWANNLTLDFLNDTIPIVTKEEEWRHFGDIVASSPTFSKLGVPDTKQFHDWRSWAERVYGLVN